MSLLANNFALIATDILAFLAGAALVYLRIECPACGWTRRDGKAGPFRYHGFVSVEPTKRRFWATNVRGTEAVPHCSRTSALEDAIRRLVDIIEEKPSTACEPHKPEIAGRKQE
jgi:hypothetical protein